MSMESLEIFNQHRSLLFAIAYRMLGSITDAEDMIQETFLRWQQISEKRVRSPKAYLCKIITRLCIDYLRSARVQREEYVGTWLPEPIVTKDITELSNVVELADALSISFLVLLENLSPKERAVFILREVFDYEYPEIASIIGKNPANCRQILRRAKQSLSLQKQTSDISFQEREQLTAKFLQAWTEGNLQDLLTLLADDVTYQSDGGGKVKSALKPLHGSRKIARFLITVRQKKVQNLISTIALINGELGIANYTEKSLHSTISFEVIENRIKSIFVVVNPEKIREVVQY